jgi:hypothetical protein
LLTSVAANFGLISGDRCSSPPVSLLWLIEVTSNPPDEYKQVFGKSSVYSTARREPFITLALPLDTVSQLFVFTRSYQTILL